MNRKNMKAYIRDLESRLAKHGEIPLTKNSWYKTIGGLYLYITYSGDMFVFGRRGALKLTKTELGNSDYRLSHKVNNHSEVESFLRENILHSLGIKVDSIVRPLNTPLKVNIHKKGSIICKKEGIWWDNIQVFSFISEKFATVVGSSKPMVGDFIITKNPFSVIQVEKDLVEDWEEAKKTLKSDGVLWKLLDRHKNVKVIADLLTLKGDFDNV